MTEVIIDSPETRLRDAVKRRIAARYRAEFRFRLYGMIAIALTALFLLIVLVDILLKGLPAFTVHQFRFDVPVVLTDIDPAKAKDPEVLRGADYHALVRDALRNHFPDVKDRVGRRRLDGLISSGASDALRHQVVADPSLVGKTLSIAALVSADAELYFKGTGTAIERKSGASAISVSGQEGPVTLSTSGSDFSEWAKAYRQRYAKLGEKLDAEVPSLLVALNGGLVKVNEIAAGNISGEVLLPLKSAGDAQAGTWQLVTYLTPESNRRVKDREVAWLEELRAKGIVERSFNWRFFTSGDSREAELAGIRGALVGSALTLLVTLLICLPLGVAAAIYLEEFAPKNRATELIEVNINNLAAVPSIVFGLLGLAVFLNFFGLPRSAPLVGGLVLALLVLPTIIIASRAALKAVPPSIKEAALGVGASHQQAVFHHVLPLAMPGILTGTIIGMAHALGETAPLLMIGMVAFIVAPATSVTDAATVLPVQIYLWSDLPEIGFQAKTAAAIIVLLMFLFVMNGAAIYLRKKFERRW
jgi:phosphate transport system permease protein